MNLFLASEAKNPVSLKALEEYVGGFSGKKIAYIPTAANGDGWGSWKDGGSWQTVQSLGAEISLVQLEDFGDSTPLDQLRGKDIIWVAGGRCGYLMYWMRRTQLDRHIQKLLEHSLYVGSSAGSMITAKNLNIVEWYIRETEHGAGIIPGLGLIDFDIYPHYDEKLLDQIKNVYKGEKMYLLKDGEALIVQDGKIKVIGEEKIIQNPSL